MMAPSTHIQFPKPRLLDQVREELRVRHYAYRTERTYIDWIKRYIFFHGTRHPREMGASEIRDFLGHLAKDRRVAASTQNQALCALVFLPHVVKNGPYGVASPLDRLLSAAPTPHRGSPPGEPDLRPPTQAKAAALPSRLRADNALTAAQIPPPSAGCPGQPSPSCDGVSWMARFSRRILHFTGMLVLQLARHGDPR